VKVPAVVKNAEIDGSSRRRGPLGPAPVGRHSASWDSVACLFRWYVLTVARLTSPRGLQALQIAHEPLDVRFHPAPAIPLQGCGVGFLVVPHHPPHGRQAIVELWRLALELPPAGQPRRLTDLLSAGIEPKNACQEATRWGRHILGSDFRMEDVVLAGHDGLAAGRSVPLCCRGATSILNREAWRRATPLVLGRFRSKVARTVCRPGPCE
jgi:hypothetical protein